MTALVPRATDGGQMKVHGQNPPCRGPRTMIPAMAAVVSLELDLACQSDAIRHHSTAPNRYRLPRWRSCTTSPPSRRFGVLWRNRTTSRSIVWSQRQAEGDPPLRGAASRSYVLGTGEAIRGLLPRTTSLLRRSWRSPAWRKERAADNYSTFTCEGTAGIDSCVGVPRPMRPSTSLCEMSQGQVKVFAIHDRRRVS